MKSAVTVSLVPEARGGPFVFWDDLEAACRSASEMGFDGIEVFAPSPDALDRDTLAGMLERHGLSLAALGTGGGWVLNRWTLTADDASVRGEARRFVRSVIEFGAPFGAPAIIGSMQGRFGGDVDRGRATAWLAEALEELGAIAADLGVVLLYEPLNRFETNLFNRQADAAEFVSGLSCGGVRLLSDLFHMNIEESDLAGAIRDAGRWIGHVHFVDSNRRAAGMGHIDFVPIVEALRSVGYGGYLSAEALPEPDPAAAAEQTIATYRRLVG